MAASSIALAVVLGACSAGATPVDANPHKPFVLGGVDHLKQIAQLTGPGAIDDTEKVAVAGTDLGSMTNLGDKTFFFFGDAFGERDPNSYGRQGGNWRSDVCTCTTDTDPSDGIAFDGWGRWTTSAGRAPSLRVPASRLLHDIGNIKLAGLK